MPRFSKFVEVEAALGWFQELEYSVLNGPDIAPGEPRAERYALLPTLMSDEVRVRDAEEMVEAVL